MDWYFRTRFRRSRHSYRRSRLCPLSIRSQRRTYPSLQNPPPTHLTRPGTLDRRRQKRIRRRYS